MPPFFTQSTLILQSITGLFLDWGSSVCVCFQPCKEACTGAVLASQRCACHQNLAHYIGLSVRTEVQPVFIPKEQEEWDKITKKPPQFGLISTQLICAAC